MEKCYITGRIGLKELSWDVSRKLEETPMTSPRAEDRSPTEWQRQRKRDRRSKNVYVVAGWDGQSAAVDGEWGKSSLWLDLRMHL